MRFKGCQDILVHWSPPGAPQPCCPPVLSSPRAIRFCRSQPADAAELQHQHTQKKYLKNEGNIKKKKKKVSSVSSRKLSGCQTTNKLETFPSLVLLDIRPEPSSFFSSSPKRFSMRLPVSLIPSCTETCPRAVMVKNL